MVRLVDEIEEGAENVFLDRVAATHFRREVFEKNANLHSNASKKRAATNRHIKHKRLQRKTFS